MVKTRKIALNTQWLDYNSVTKILTIKSIKHN